MQKLWKTEVWKRYFLLYFKVYCVVFILAEQFICKIGQRSKTLVTIRVFSGGHIPKSPSRENKISIYQGHYRHPVGNQAALWTYVTSVRLFWELLGMFCEVSRRTLANFCESRTAMVPGLESSTSITIRNFLPSKRMQIEQFQQRTLPQRGSDIWKGFCFGGPCFKSKRIKEWEGLRWNRENGQENLTNYSYTIIFSFFKLFLPLA